MKGVLKKFIERRLLDIHEYHRDVEIEKFSIKEDHLHVVVVITPRHSVSAIVGKIKANTSREIREEFEWERKVYRRNEFWSPGFFSSTVGIDEEVIKR